MSVWNKDRDTTDYGLRNTTRTQSVVPFLYWLNPVHQDSSEYSVQLYPSNSISDFRLVEKHERALIDTPAVWRCPQRVTQNFSSRNFNPHRNEAVGSISLDSIGEFKALWFSWDRLTWVSGLSKGRGQGREDGKKGLTQTSLLDHVVHPDSGRCADWIIYNAPWRHTTGIKNFITAYSVNWSRRERKLR